jgi:hypothetical protein
MVDIYENLLGALFNYSNSFFLTILIVVIINNLIVKFLETYLDKVVEKIKDYDDYVKLKEDQVIRDYNDKKRRREALFRLHDKYSFNPLFRLIYIIPFTIQIPFLISVYFALERFYGFKGVSFLFINDLAQSDNLFFGINLLPILMFIINLIIIRIQIKNPKINSILFPVVFLIILYNAPSSLIIYWTLSLIFSPLISNIFNKNFMSINDIVFKKITFALNYSVKAFLNKERVTNFALFGAYFIFLSYNNFKDFNFLILFFLVVISFDFILKIKNVLYNVLVFSLLYSMIVYYDTLFIVHEMRISYFIVIFTSITAITFIIIDKYKLEYYTNIFLLFLLISFPFLKIDYSFSERDSGFKDITVNNSTAPFILLILDGLSSSDDVFSVTKDSSAYNYEKALTDLKYNNITSINSLSSRTKYSLPSIFNFNLHNAPGSNLIALEGKNENARTHDKYLQLFEENSLVDSLRLKGVKSSSYGYVKFKNGLNPNENYPWENFYFYNFLNTNTNFFRRFFSPTFFNIIFKLNISDSFVDDYQRKSILDNLKDFQPANGNFYYFHLKMPHPPYTYFDEFQVKSNDSEFNIHLAFKDFLLDKLKPILEQEKFNDSRIIIMGDHGLKDDNDNSLDRYKTSLYYKGIDRGSFSNIKSIQDIGYIINDSF